MSRMKRDMDLVRKILLALEEHEEGFAPPDFHVRGYSEDQVGYHVHLMIQGGLLLGCDTTHLGSTSPTASATSMTWLGHDFLDAARDKNVWHQAKAIVEKLGSAAFEVWKAVLIEVTKRSLGL